MPVAPCKECGRRPKITGRHRCIVCQTRHEPIDEQVARARVRVGMIPPELRVARVPKWAWPAGQRWCASCQSFIDLVDVQGSRCRACASAASHSAMIERTYGLTREQYDGLLELQGGRCAICRARPKSKRLAVDHDHKSGKVRGLLCSRCNHDLMGAAWDSAAMAKALLAYVETPPATGTWTAPEDSARAATKPGRPDLMAAGASTSPPRGANASTGRTAPLALDVAEQVERLLAAGAVSVPGKKGVWRVFVEPGGDPPF